MSYSDFTLELVASRLGVTTAEGDLFPQLMPLTPPAWLIDTLKRNTRLAYLNEKSKSEFIVSPILNAVRELVHNRLAIFSGQRLDVDASSGLTGECDFILSLGPTIPPLRAPIAIVVEAKRGDIELALGQCVAQMVAAARFNQKADASTVIHGCITSAESWQFVRLDGNIASFHNVRFFETDLGMILAAFAAMTERSRALAA